MNTMENAGLLQAFNQFIPFAETLRPVPGDLWEQSMTAGKWAIRDVIAHIMRWDQYFLKEAIAPLTSGQAVTLRHLDFDTFNAGAAPYAQTVSQQQLIDETIACRKAIIQCIDSLSEHERHAEHLDGNGHIFTVYGYLEGFVPHDDQHRREIEQFLSKH